MPRRTTKKRWTEIKTDWLEIKQEIDAAAHGMKTPVKKEIAERLGISIHQLHSALREEFGPAKIIKERTFNSEEHADAYEQNRRIAYLVAEQKEKMKRAGEGERELATHRVLRILQEWGVDGADQVSESTINRILREEMGYRQSVPRVRHEPEYALQEVQVDFSFSKYFSIVDYDQDLGDYLLKASSTLLRYKEGDRRMRPMLGVIIDSYSRVRWHYCMAASGESGSNTTAFMIKFFNRQQDDLVFQHVPWLFRMDNGPLAKSQEGKSFFASIDRKVETSMPYEKTGIGKAERTWQNIWQWEMEQVSRIGVGGIISMSDYNLLLLNECVRQQHRQHPVYADRQCVDVYQQSILIQQPRPEIISADLTDAVFTSLERTVKNDQTFSINNIVYEAPVSIPGSPHTTTGQRIRVLMHRDGRMIGELIDRNAPSFEIRKHQPSATGRFSSRKRTFAQQLNNEISDGRAITEQLRKVADMTVKQKEEHFGGPRRLMPKADELQIESPFTGQPAQFQEPERCFTKFEALQLVAELLKQEGIDMNDQLHDYFTDYAVKVNLNREMIQLEVANLMQILNNNQTGT